MVVVAAVAVVAVEDACVVDIFTKMAGGGVWACSREGMISEPASAHRLKTSLVSGGMGVKNAVMFGVKNAP